MLWRPEKAAQTLAAPHFERLRTVVLGHTIPVTREAIGDDRLEWLKALPHRWSLENDLAVVHASPGDAWTSPGVSATDEDLERVYRPLATRRALYGHIHHPYLRTLERLTVANAGSVSLSYDGDPRASYAIVDADRIEIRRVAYDIEEEVARLQAARDTYVEWLAQMLRTGSFVPLPPD
jgi:diadenosine tetraphosphatase ApaH/serine/threonine PP2A family protein phosphatase